MVFQSLWSSGFFHSQQSCVYLSFQFLRVSNHKWLNYVSFPALPLPNVFALAPDSSDPIGPGQFSTLNPKLLERWGESKSFSQLQNQAYSSDFSSSSAFWILTCFKKDSYFLSPRGMFLCVWTSCPLERFRLFLCQFGRLTSCECQLVALHSQTIHNAEEGFMGGGYQVQAVGLAQSQIMA